MALRAMYKGFKKVQAPLIIIRPGELAINQDALNTELNTVFFPRSEQAILGAKNLLDNQAVSGGNFTVNENKTITVNGTFSERTVLYIRSKLTKYAPPAGTYNLLFSDVSNKFNFVVDAYLGDTWVKNLATTKTHTTFSLDYNGYDRVVVFMVIEASELPATFTNVIFKPMITIATDTDFTYAPPTMTNQQLTGEVATLNGSASDQKTAINAIIAAATGSADFAAFKTAMGAITPVTRSIQVTPETREEITEPVEEVKKTTRKKSTAKADTAKEGE